MAIRPLPKVELVLSDDFLLLPPTVTPLTGNVLYLFLTASYIMLAVEGIVLGTIIGWPQGWCQR